MNREKVRASSGNYWPNPPDSRRTRSIVADSDAFRVVTSTLVFVAVMLAIPTIMALLKSWGVW